MSDAFDSSMVGHTTENAREAFQATGGAVQQAGTMIGAEILPVHDTHQGVNGKVRAILGDGGSLIRSRPSKASFNTLITSNTVAKKLLQYDANRKIARISMYSSVVDFPVIAGTEAAINQYLGVAIPVGTVSIPGVIILPCTYPGVNTGCIMEYTAVNELWILASQPASNTTVSVIDETYDGAPGIG